MKKFQKKKFLNKDSYHSIAAISIMLEAPSNEESKGREWLNGSIYVNDCTRVIELTLDLDSEGEVDNSLHKINSILEVCLQAKEFLIENKESYIKNSKLKNEY